MTDTIIHEASTETIHDAGQVSAKIAHIYRKACEALQDGYAVELTAKPLKRTRSLRANACLWATLTDISRQVVWYGNRLEPQEWKDVLTASLKRQRVVPGLDGGFIAIGARTSKMSIKEMSALIELAYAFGTQHGVKFTAPKWMEDSH